MNINTFITTYNGKKVDYDNSYGSQCVDLFRFYVRDVLGTPQPKGVTGAKDFWTNYETDANLNKYFDKIPNSPTGVPQAGDVMVWGSGYGQFGHIAIVTEATVNSFKALSQNDPLNRETHIKSYNYNNTLGWLRPKGTMSELHTYLGVTTDAEAKNKLKEHLGEANSKCNWGLTGDQGGYLGSERKKNNELTALNVSHITEIEAQKAKIAELEQELADCEAEAPENDLTGWVKNGLVTEVTTGNTKVITNYKPA